MGAWIETCPVAAAMRGSAVAPCMGAWIETSIVYSRSLSVRLSHPVWVRGLKL